MSRVWFLHIIFANVQLYNLDIDIYAWLVTKCAKACEEIHPKQLLKGRFFGKIQVHYMLHMFCINKRNTFEILTSEGHKTKLQGRKTSEGWWVLLWRGIPPQWPCTNLVLNFNNVSHKRQTCTYIYIHHRIHENGIFADILPYIEGKCR